jgi:pimeloyl-ACP methyl ester carboxylesterase
MKITVAPGRPAAALAMATVLAAGVAACGSTGHDTAAQERTTRTDVPFKGCDQVACQGELNGAAYDVWLPRKWNGTLLLYSHGYRPAAPVPPDFAPVERKAEAAPSEELAGLLLAQGFALAGSGYASNGWAVADGVKAGEKLHDWFAGNVAKPDRVYVWGGSLGGLITEVLAERHPDWVTGAAPACGVLAGGSRNLDLALDTAYAVKTLIYPQLKLTDFASHADAVANWQGAYKAILAAGADVQRGVPKLMLVAAIVDAPHQTRTYDGSTTESQVRAIGESLLSGLGYGTWGRYEIEQRVSGNPSSNTETDYKSRVSSQERQAIETLFPGTVDANLGLLEQGQRVAEDPGAREALDALGTPTGDLQDPTITLHTAADPLVLAQNETVFADEVAASTGRTADLLQLYTVAPATYSTKTGAPFGAGHCNFTTTEILALIKLLDDWARNGVYPGPAAIEQAFGTPSGLQLAFRPGPWPAK